MKSSAVDDENAMNKSILSYIAKSYVSNIHFTVLTATSIILFSSDRDV